MMWVYVSCMNCIGWAPLVLLRFQLHVRKSHTLLPAPRNLDAVGILFLTSQCALKYVINYIVRNALLEHSVMVCLYARGGTRVACANWEYAMLLIAVSAHMDRVMMFLGVRRITMV
jgi:hypothetical protein